MTRRRAGRRPDFDAPAPDSARPRRDAQVPALFFSLDGCGALRLHANGKGTGRAAMTRIGDNLRPVIEAGLARAAARRARTERLRRAAEADWRRSLHPEADPFAAAEPGWTGEQRAARERFRRAHVAETRARDAELDRALALSDLG
jgi:hypothetical protein